jgi:hypothetical protein
MNKRLLSLLALGLALGCSPDGPTAPNRPASDLHVGPTLSVAGTSGCYTVQGTISETGIPPSFSGTMHGDLEGTTVTEAFGAIVTGAVVHSPGVHSYTITGGKVPELIGEVLQLASQNTIVYTQDNPLIARINSTQRVESPGSGNLTVHGSFDFTAFPPAVVELRYQGVVCP